MNHFSAICIWGGVILTTVTLVIWFLLMPSICIVPTVHYGLVLRFKRRTGRVLNEGLNFILPYIDTVEFYKEEIEIISIKESFFCKDNLQVLLKGSVRWKVDKDLLNKVFIAISEDTITTGLADTIKSELGIIAGTESGLAFIRFREAIENLINCQLRMRTPLHITNQISRDERLKFYEDNSIGVRDYLSTIQSQDRSEIEERYGIDIIGFSLADVDFSPETKKAFEKEQQAQAELKARKLKLSAKVEMSKRLQDEIGLKPQSAINSAEVTMEEAKKKVFSVEGLDGLMELLKGGKQCPTK